MEFAIGYLAGIGADWKTTLIVVGVLFVIMVILKNKFDIE